MLVISLLPLCFLFVNLFFMLLPGLARYFLSIGTLLVKERISYIVVFLSAYILILRYRLLT